MDAILSTKILSDVQLSCDNRTALFVASEPKFQDKEKKGLSLSRIYKTSVGTQEATLFSAPDHCSLQPRWSPKGPWIAFLSDRNGTKNLYLIHGEGGEARALTTGDKEVQTFAWSPDGQKIAFVRADKTEKEKKRTKTSLSYTYQQNISVNRLWVIDVFSSDLAAIPLTSDAYCVRGTGDFGTALAEFDWSIDSREITFAYAPSVELEDFYLNSSLATVEIATTTIRPWKKGARYEALPRYSPDGRWVAYIYDDSSHRYAIDRMLAIRTAEGTEPRTLAPTYNGGAFLSGHSFLGWTREGTHLLFFEPKGTQFHLTRVPIDGGAAQGIDTHGIFFKEPALSHDRTMIGYIAQTPATPAEAFVAPLDSFTPFQLSTLNHPLLSYPHIETTAISWASNLSFGLSSSENDGMQIEGLLTYPVNYKKGTSYPLLIIIHGGPMSFFDETFVATPYPYPFAAFAQEGFLVFKPNPRGSCGYGKPFRCANYHDWAGGDFLDIMLGIDHLIAQGIADPERLGVMGWSYGGYMTAWAITQTSRFKAASMGAGLCNLVSMNGTTDLHLFLTDYLGDVATHRELYEERSPINHVHRVTTPCLIQHGTEDKRVPPSQAYEFYHALVRVGQQPTLLLYPGMGHRLSDPHMLRDAMEANLTWFRHHL